MDKKRTLLIATSVIRGLPLELRRLSSQESDLTTEIDNRNRRAAVANIADDLSSVLRLEVLVPEVVQRDLARGDAASKRNAESPGMRIVMSPLFDLNS